MTSARIRSPTACLLSGSSTSVAAPRTDILHDLAERELAQRGELVGSEEVLERGFGAVDRIDLAGAKPLLERFRREVDQDHLVRVVEDPVGERLAHPNACELEDGVVEALEMLHVDGRDHVDPGLEHLVDVLVALRVPRARRVRVRELVDERELGRPPDHRVRIELVELERAVADLAARHDLQPFGERRRLRSVVRLEIADHDVDALGRRLPPSWSIR